jgi:hypothetical protein
LKFEGGGRFGQSTRIVTRLFPQGPGWPAEGRTVRQHVS